MENEKYLQIVRVEIEDLFNFFNYSISATESNIESRLLLLYGDNGSGKTTILRLIFYLLSCRDKAGHKTAVSKIPFKKFSIQLSNNTVISATREISRKGSFKYSIDNKLSEYKESFSVTLSNDKESASRIMLDRDSTQGKVYKQMLDFIASLNVKLFYLSDTRKSLDSILINSGDFSNEPVRLFNLKIRDKDKEEVSLIKETVELLDNYFKSEVIKASDIGERETNNIYLDIIKQLEPERFSENQSLSNRVNDLKNILQEVAQRSDKYAKFGLVSTTEYSQINNALSVSGANKEVIFNVLEPFIRGMKVKLDVLRNIERQISSLTDFLNSFLSFKSVSYKIQEGFKVIQQGTGDLIELDSLSSGEKQLILLFGNVILMSGQATIFIIDEPEISLNIKWQRRLVDFLLDLNPGKNTQYLIATHSIELLTTQKNSIVKLQNK
jgi:ABC-type cobalamin/Fe3+-siderophores transport system ATPase subunit